MTKLRKYAYSGLVFVGAVAMAAAALYATCRTGPPAAYPVGVFAKDFPSPTRAAMGILNGYIGCEAFVTGHDVTVQSANGAPCGDFWRPPAEEGHSATTYQCGNKFEIHISKPGDLHTQACIIAHELGHAAGLPDRIGNGIMNQHRCAEPIRVSDWEVRRLRGRRAF